MSTGGGGGDNNNPNRTVFRPSPLQGLRDQQQQQQGGGQGTQFTPAPGAPGPASLPPSPSMPSAPPVQPAARLRDDDIPRPATPPQARNRMMMAAGPILALLASVRAGRARLPLPELHQKASQAVAAFDAEIGQTYPEEQRQRAKYALCATIDDIAQNLPGQAQDGAEWARRSLVVMFFSENIGGDRFWQLVDDMIARPGPHADLIELYHACLAAGFEGRFRVMPDGKRGLHEIMTKLYGALEHPRRVSRTELVLNWRGQPTPARKLGFWAPLALAAGVALAILLAIYLILRVVLAQTGGPSMAALRATNPDQPLRLSRVAPAAPAPQASTQLQRLRTFLAPEIAQGLVVVDEDPSSIRVRTTVGQLFTSGSDQLVAGRRALFERIGAATNTEPGRVRVEGHADSDRVASLTFPDNFALSRARADVVADIIRSELQDPSRVESEGFGDGQPIASNATAEGKALNRRVEIVIPRSQ